MTATVNRRTPLHQGRVFLLVRENVTLDNGVSTDLDYIEHPGAAAIVPLIARGDVLLIDDSTAMRSSSTSGRMPAGTRRPGRTVMDCARRELIEETGYAAGCRRTQENRPCPCYSDERVHLFLASELSDHRPPRNSMPTVLTVHRMPSPRP